MTAGESGQPPGCPLFPENSQEVTLFTLISLDWKHQISNREQA
jgi:hypothetical protein